MQPLSDFVLLLTKGIHKTTRKDVLHVYCEFCGKQIRDIAAFCPHCGKPTAAQTQAQTRQQRQTSAQVQQASSYTASSAQSASHHRISVKRKKPNNLVVLIVGIALILAVGAIGFYAINRISAMNQRLEQAQTSSASQNQMASQNQPAPMISERGTAPLDNTSANTEPPTLPPQSEQVYQPTTQVPSEPVQADEGVEAPNWNPFKLLSEYCKITPICGSLEKEFYYTEYFDIAIDLTDIRNPAYIYKYVISLNSYSQISSEKTADGNVKTIYENPGTGYLDHGKHRIVICSGDNGSWVSYQNIYTSGLRYDEYGNTIPEPVLKTSNTIETETVIDPGGQIILPDLPIYTPAYSTCPRCNGSGRVKCDTCNGTGYYAILERRCPRCNGDGTTICLGCGGTGKIP